MTNKKVVRRLGGIILAIAMVVGLCLPSTTMAAGNGSEIGTITIENVDEAAESVTAYKIVEPIIKDGVVTGYQVVDGTTGVTEAFTDKGKLNFEKEPIAAELAKIIPIDNGEELTKTESAGTWSNSDLTSGIYLIKVQTNGSWIYNPMIVGLSYDDEDGIADKEFSIPISDDHAIAKKSEINVTKEITNPINNNKNNKGNDTQIGDVIEFKITAPIANYSDKYEEITLKLGDTLSEGLDFVSTKDQVSVTVDGEETPANNDKTVTTEIAGQKLTITVTGDQWIKANGGKNIIVTYQAKLNENAVSNFNQNTNDVIYTFSNNPYDTNSKGESKDKTYHYTFEIDGTVFGELSSHEFIKTGNGIEKIESEITEYGALKDAEFMLYTDKECKNPFNDMEAVKTDDKGYLHIKGLDGNKTYYLKETNAPAPYMVNDKVIKFNVVADYNKDGTLKNYYFEVDDIKQQKFTATYENEAPSVNVTKETEGNHFEFENTTTPKLPSTGGMGTYAFTIFGVAAIAVAGNLYIKKKKRTKQVNA